MYSITLSNGLGLHVRVRSVLPSGAPHLDIIISGQTLPELGILKWGLVAKQPHSELPSDRTLPHQVRALPSACRVWVNFHTSSALILPICDCLQTWWPDGTRRVPEWLECGDVGTPFLRCHQVSNCMASS